MTSETAEIPPIRLVPSPEPPEPYPLPEVARTTLLDLARDSDVLVIGELHGTQEIPRLIAALAPDLYALGYRGLAFELPSDLRDDVAMWGVDPTRAVPRFYARPGSDGRGNADVLGLIHSLSTGWQLLCYDQATSDGPMTWAERDARMAANLTAQRHQYCPGGKVLAVCGNLHSRVRRTTKPGERFHDYWPAFAAKLAESNPFLCVTSIKVEYRCGAFYNGGMVRLLHTAEPLPEPYVEEDPAGEHDLVVHLPRATLPVFLAPPATE
jgi:hypothetical protein